MRRRAALSLSEKDALLHARAWALRERAELLQGQFFQASVKKLIGTVILRIDDEVESVGAHRRSCNAQGFTRVNVSLSWPP
jgi:hypothetical protein